jgi:hypothetical protein
MPLTIISGGQTGVDRAALDAALACDIACGGWCPRGRMAEDGRIPDRYPLTEMPGTDYRQRTIKNVRQSDGTLIIYFGRMTGGTKLTHDSCIKHDVPCLLIDGALLDIGRAADEISRFIDSRHIKLLNVAGPRASNHAGAYEYTYNVLSAVLQGGDQ